MEEEAESGDREVPRTPRQEDTSGADPAAAVAQTSPDSRHPEEGTSPDEGQADARHGSCSSGASEEVGEAGAVQGDLPVTGTAREEEECRGEEEEDGETLTETRGEGEKRTDRGERGFEHYGMSVIPGTYQEEEEEEEEEEVVVKEKGREVAGESSLAGPGSGASSAQEKRTERMRRLRELHMRRNEARKQNHAEVVEEDKRNKLPANWEARKRKLDWELAEEQAMMEAEEAGEDYDQLKRLDTSAAEVDRRDRKKKKKNPDTGFSGFADAQFRQYQRLTKQFTPDLEAYEKQKKEKGADFFPGVNTVEYGGAGKVSKEGLDRMVADLDKQIDKRAKYSRRREFRDDGDVDYINERNRKFNQKAARFYNKYTAETKQNLERGTAV